MSDSSEKDNYLPIWLEPTQEALDRRAAPTHFCDLPRCEQTLERWFINRKIAIVLFTRAISPSTPLEPAATPA